MTSLDSITSFSRRHPVACRYAGYGTCIAVLLVELLIVLATHPSGVFPLIAYLAAAVAVYTLLMGELKLEVFVLYTVYAGAIIGIYYLQYAESPLYLGFSGPEGTYGTDDTFFFSQVAEHVPYIMDVRRYFQFDPHEFSTFLKSATIIPVDHLFDIIWVNLVGAVMLPVFTRELAVEVTENEKAGNVAFVLMAICPFTLANSLILMRDGWSATLFVGGILFFLRKKFVRMLILAVTLFYLRIASALQLAAALGLYSVVWVREVRSITTKRLLMAGQVLSAALGGVGVFFVLSQFRGVTNVSELVSLFFRSDFLLFFQQHRPDSFLFSLYQLPFVIRLPVTFVFFLLFPFVEFGEVMYGDVFVIRGLMMVAYSTLFIVYFGYFVRGVIHGVTQENNLRLVVTIGVFLFLILLVSQISMQIRHKVMILPLMYIIVAVGAVIAKKKTWVIGVLASLGMLGLNLLKYLASV